MSLTRYARLSQMPYGGVYRFHPGFARATTCAGRRVVLRIMTLHMA